MCSVTRPAARTFLTEYHDHPDQLGSIRALTDGSGTVVASRDYDGYGNPTVTSGSVRTPFGYSGEYTDAESGLVYLRARYYDPLTQQFLTKDTMLTQLPYSYINGNPTNWRDPSGHCVEDACIGELVLVSVLCPECVLGGLLVTVGVVLTAEVVVVIHDAWERQQASNPACVTQLAEQSMTTSDTNVFAKGGKQNIKPSNVQELIDEATERARAAGKSVKEAMQDMYKGSQ